MNNDEVIRLILETVGQEGVEKLSKALTGLKGKVVDAAESYEVSTDRIGAWTKEHQKAQDATDRMVAEATEATRAQKLMRDALEETAAAQGKVTASTKKSGDEVGKAGRSFIEAGRFLQDFSAAGVNGVANNIEGMIQSLRNVPITLEGITAVMKSPAGIVGGATFIVTALAVMAPKIQSFFQGIIDGANDVPEAAGKLDRMTEALGKNKKELDDLAGKQQLTNTELARYNELLGKQAELEKEVAKERERKAANEKLKGLKTSDQEADQQETASLLKDQFGGGEQNEIQEQVEQSIGRNDPEMAKLRAEMKKALQQENKDLGKAFSKADVAYQLAHHKKIKDAIEARMKARAEANAGTATDLMDNAFLKGDEGAVGQIAGMLPEGPQRQQFEDILPANRKRRAAQIDAQNNAFREAKAQEEAEDAAFERSIEERQNQVKERNARRSRLAARGKQQEQWLDNLTNEQIRGEEQEAAEAIRAPKRAQQARHEQTVEAEKGRIANAENAVINASQAAGIPMTPEMTLQAAKQAVQAASQGVDADTAIMGAISEVVTYARQVQQQYQQIANQARMFRGQMQTLTSYSDSRL